MRPVDDILPLAIEQVGLVIFNLIGWTGIHLSLRSPVKWKLRRAGTRLKVLEGFVQRLMLVMALQTDLPPVKPRRTANKIDDTPNVPSPENLSEFSDITLAEFPRVRQPSLTLLPPPMDYSEGVDLSQLPLRNTPVHIMARRFSRRIIALQKVLDAPEAHARRLARALHRIRKAGVPKPVLFAGPFPNGFRPELSLLHVGVNEQLRNALKAWDTS
ncbi:MAG: hypothetical protein AAGF33_12645 [Pseudomonadota bacterium]